MKEKQRDKSNQEYAERYKLKKEEYVRLFKTMLEFVNCKYENEDFYYLSSLVQYNYPYYFDVLIHLENLMYTVDESYESLLDSMEKIYNKMISNYKNHKENMQKYEEEKHQYEFGNMEEDNEF